MIQIFKHEYLELNSCFWKKNTKRICCWLDTEPFEGCIYSYPTRKENNKWIVKGVFCSLSCVKRYIVNNCFMNSTIFSLFSLMCIEVYGISQVKTAPDVTLLRKFCVQDQRGLTIKEFRDNCTIQLINPPVYPFLFETMTISKNEINHKKKLSIEEKNYTNTKSNTSEVNLNCFFKSAESLKRESQIN